jgi:hypothetical protein
MIILSDNPVGEISNTKKIEAVINNGQFIEWLDCVKIFLHHKSSSSSHRKKNAIVYLKWF